MNQLYPLKKIVVVQEVDGAFSQKKELEVHDVIAARHQDARWSVVDRGGVPMRMAFLDAPSFSVWVWEPEKDALNAKFESLLLHHVRANLTGTTLYVFPDNPQQAPLQARATTKALVFGSAENPQWGSW